MLVILDQNPLLVILDLMDQQFLRVLQGMGIGKVVLGKIFPLGIRLELKQWFP